MHNGGGCIIAAFGTTMDVFNVFLQIVFVAGPMVAHRTGKFTLLMSCTYVFSEYISVRRGKITEAAFMWLCI